MADSYNSYDDSDYGLGDSDSLLCINVKEKSIASDLVKYKIPEDIIAKADELYKRDNVKICRQKKRIHLLFYYTLHAYRDSYKDIDPNKIAKIFNLTQGDAMTAVSTFNKKKDSDNVNFTSPLRLTLNYCKDLNIVDEEILNEIKTLCLEVIHKNPNLLNSYPQTVASGILWYYFQTSNYEPDRLKFEQIVGRSTATIKKTAKLIGTIDNEL